MPDERGVFLDRDGTLNKDAGFTYKLEDFQLLPHVAEGLKLLKGLGFRLVIAANQSGIGRGFFTEEDMNRFNGRLLSVLKTDGIEMDGIYHSPLSPGASPDPGSGVLARKPDPAMLLKAATDLGINLAKSYMIGDRNADIGAGKAAGCFTLLVMTGRIGNKLEPLTETPDYTAANLHEAALFIRRREKEN